MTESPKSQVPNILIFVFVVSLFLFIANLVVYEALAGIFNLTGSSTLALGMGLGFLSGSFVLSTILGMRYYNSFTRTYYSLSAIWIGFSVYLFLVSVVWGIAVMIFGLLPAVVGESLLAFAICVSICGALHARTINIVKLEISLPHLPEAWQGRRAILVSDLHLGQLHGSHFARKVVEKINSLPHDIIFIAGDLYDGTGAPDLDELTSPLRDLIAPLGTYFITGNHEEFGDNNAFVNAVRSANIIPLIDQMADVDGLQIIGVDYRNASNKERFKNILSGLDIRPDLPSILLKHEPKDVDVARDAGISFQMSGHTHRTQMWPLEYIAKWMYKDFAYGYAKLGDMQVYTSSGVGTWGPPLRVGTNAEMVHITFV